MVSFLPKPHRALDDAPDFEGLDTVASFTPIPKKLRGSYRFRHDHFFADEDAFRKELAALGRSAARMKGLEGSLAKGPAALLAACRMRASLWDRLTRVAIHANLRWAVNVRDDGPKTRVDELAAELQAAEAWFQPELMSLGAKKVEGWIAREKKFAPFAHALRVWLRDEAHVLSTKEEALLATLSERLTGWTDPLYNLLLTRRDFGTVRDADGRELHVRRQAGECAIHPDRKLRRKAHEQRMKAYGRHRDLFAFELVQQARTLNTLARISRFRDAPEQVAFSKWLEADEVEAIYEAVALRAPLYKDYQRLRRRRVAALTGIRSPRIWDMALQKPGFRHPRFDVVNATAVVREALAPLGDEYLELYDELMDPRRGCLDLVSGPGRSPGAFSTRAHGGPSFIYSFGYQGLAREVSTLAHEAGHALQGALQARRKRPYFRCAFDPGFFTEAFALVNELLFVEDRSRKTRGDEAIYWLESLVAKKLSLFSKVETASLEWEIFRRVDRGELTDADSFDVMTRAHLSRFGIWPEIEKSQAMRWCQVMHFTASPLYYINYVGAQLLGLVLYERIKADAAFVPRYLELVANGFDRPPAQLMQDFCGLDPFAPDVVEATLDAQVGEIARLREAYERE